MTQAPSHTQHDSRSHAGKHFAHCTEEAPSRALRVAAHFSRLLFALGVLLFSVVQWLARTWSELSPDEIIFHLKASLSGTDTTVIWTFCLRYLPLALLACAAAFYLQHRLGKGGLRGYRMFTVGLALAGIAIAGTAFWSFSEMVNLQAFLTSEEQDGESGFIAANYVNPQDVKLEFPAKKRNLIYLYLESMELTYADEANGGAWDENLIPELTELAHEGNCFNGTGQALKGAYVMPGTGWTIGAMFGQSSGVPLKLPFFGNFISEQMTDFFPGLTTLGDLLEDAGYRQVLMLGSDASFGSRDEFFHEHGNFDIYDYPYAQQTGVIDPSYKVFWGFEDQKLFAWAKQVLPELAAADEPFNLTMLTVDTHFEDGYVCELCGTEHGDNQYANVMSCSSRQVADFVHWLQKQDFYQDTTVVICGDHTTMDSNFCKGIPSSYDRSTYTSILNSAVSCADPTAVRSYSTLDLFPTTLAAMGVAIEGDRLGLGANLFASAPTIVETYGLDECKTELRRMSLFLDQFSDASLSDMMIEQTKNECTLSYDDGSRGFGGFLLGDMHLLDPTMIEDARLELTDDRTQETTSYTMVEWSSNEKFKKHASLDLTHYYLAASVSLDEDALAHVQARAYVTVSGYDEQLYGSWSQNEGADEEQDEKS